MGTRTKMMTRTTKEAIRKAKPAVALLIAALAPVSIAAQEACSGTLRGDLGIQGLSCTGSCVMSLASDDGRFSFSTEPEVAAVDPDGPTADILREGDRIVAIDGVLITTRAGGERFSALEPGATVELSYRRDGRVRTAEVETGARCEADSEERRAEREAVERALVQLQAAREREARGVQQARQALMEELARAEAATEEERAEATRRIVEAQAALGRALALPSPRLSSPGASLGLSFRCDDCQATVTEEGTRWSFARPIEVYRVVPGGAADRAGIRPGDLIRRIDGSPIESREGGEKFSDVEPGQTLLLTVSRPDGSFANVPVVPDQSEAQRERAAVEAERAAQLRAEGLAREGTWEERPLRFSGAVGPASVVVRGGPVNVVRDPEAGILIIRSGETEIRISVPPGSDDPGEG